MKKYNFTCRTFYFLPFLLFFSYNLIYICSKYDIPEYNRQRLKHDYASCKHEQFNFSNKPINMSASVYTHILDYIFESKY